MQITLRKRIGIPQQLSASLLALCALSFTSGSSSAATPAAETNAGATRLVLAGADEMTGFFKQLNLLFAAKHPKTGIEMALKGSATGLPALTAGAASIALLTHEPNPGEIAAFQQAWGYAPTAIRIGYAGAGPASPPAVYVNQRNPLPRLSMQQLAQVFTAGSPAGDVNFWSQLGLKGSWEQRRIHLYGLRDDGGIATVLRTKKLGKLPFSPHYEALASPQAVLDAVADDPYGIALLGPTDIRTMPESLRILPLSPAGAAAASAAVMPSRENVAAGKYPLTVYVSLYFNRPAGQALDGAIKNYLKTALSFAGQNLMVQTADTACCLPLSIEDLMKEKKKLE